MSEETTRGPTPLPRDRTEQVRGISHTLRMVGLALFIYLLTACAFVAYDEEMIRTANLIDDLSLVREIGPTSFEGENDAEGNILRPSVYHPVIPPGSGGYLLSRDGDDLLIFHDDGNRISRIGERTIRGNPRTAQYAARVVSVGTIDLSREEAESRVPLFLVPYADGFQELLLVFPTGEQDSRNLTDVVIDAVGNGLGDTPTIVGAHFYAEPAATREGITEYLSLLARNRNGSTFREVRVSLTYTADLSLEFASPSGFALPNVGEDELIENGAYVFDPLNGESYVTVRDGGAVVTYRWTTDNPGADAPAAIEGTVSYVPMEGGVATVDKETLRRYREGGLSASQNIGLLEPLGRYWTGSEVLPLFSVVGVSHGLPTDTLSAELFAADE